MSCVIGTNHACPRTLWIAPHASAILAKIARTPRARLAIVYELCLPPAASSNRDLCSYRSMHPELAQHVPGGRSDVGMDCRGLARQNGRGLGALIYSERLLAGGTVGAWLDLGPRALPHRLGEPLCPRLGGEIDILA
ncbi:MAG: hypothetical protein K1X74_03825 [Pirellulales bacterium]|nr:hypothetical protein [Pirellulales bacterium]